MATALCPQPLHPFCPLDPHQVETLTCLRLIISGPTCLAMTEVVEDTWTSLENGEMRKEFVVP